MSVTLSRIFHSAFWKHPLTTTVLGASVPIITALLMNLGNLMEIRFFPKTEMLNDFGAVLNKAAEVIKKSDKEIYLATDVAAMGAYSQKSAFRNYVAALRLAKSREANSQQLLDVTWLKQADEVAETKAEHLCKKDAQEVLDASSSIRKEFASSTVRERTLPSLMFFYFWTGETKEGAAGSVIAFNEGMDPNEPVKGFYTNSKDVYAVLKRVQSVLASEKIEDEVRNSYELITGCKRLHRKVNG